LDVVVGESTAIFQLLASKDQTLLIWGNAFLVLDLGFDILYGVRRFNLKGDGLASQSLDKNLHATSETQYQVEGGLLLDVVVGESTAIFQLLASKDQTLLIWGNAFLILNFCFYVLNGVWRLDFKSNSLASQGFDKDLHATTETENQMQSGFLLDIVVGESAAILQLLAGKDQTLLIWGNTFLVLDLGLDVFDGIGRLNLKGDGLASQSLDKDLHASPQSQDQMKSRFLLDIVVREGTTILQLLASEDQTLLIWGNAFLVLNLGLDIFNGVWWLNLKGDGLASQSLDKDLHASPQSQDQMKGRFLLDIVVREGAAILQLLASKDQTLLVWGNALLVLDLSLDIFDGIRRLNLEGDGLSS